MNNNLSYALRLELLLKKVKSDIPNQAILRNDPFPIIDDVLDRLYVEHANLQGAIDDLKKKCSSYNGCGLDDLEKEEIEQLLEDLREIIDRCENEGCSHKEELK